MDQMDTQVGLRIGPDRSERGSQVEPPAEHRVREHYAWWRGVRVTDETMTSGDRSFEIRELRRLRAHQGRPQAIRQAVIGVAAGQAGVVAVALAALARAAGPSPTIIVVGLAEALTTTILVAIALVRWPTPTELWALHRGEPTMLYRGPDRFEFGKVHRAVERAMLARRLLKERE